MCNLWVHTHRAANRAPGPEERGLEIWYRARFALSPQGSCFLFANYYPRDEIVQTMAAIRFLPGVAPRATARPIRDVRQH